jgi:hypothetical protein
MFSLTLRDHLHVTFGQIVEQHQSHARKAFAHARWGRRLRGVEALLMGVVCIAAVSAAFTQGRITTIAAAVTAGAALLVLLVHLAFDFDGSARAHAEMTNRLWHIRERYRALLSDLQEGVVELGAARARRDALMDELQQIYRSGPMSPSDAHPGATEDATKKSEPVKNAPAA